MIFFLKYWDDSLMRITQVKYVLDGPVAGATRPPHSGVPSPQRARAPLQVRPSRLTRPAPAQLLPAQPRDLPRHLWRHQASLSSRTTRIVRYFSSFLRSVFVDGFDDAHSRWLGIDAINLLKQANQNWDGQVFFKTILLLADNLYCNRSSFSSINYLAIRF